MSPGPLKTLIGPRIPQRELARNRGRYVVPTALLSLAGLLLLVSIFTPYWQMTLHAPQYPRGLKVKAYLNRLTGDVAEIDGLNHYIGMRPLNEAAQLERSLAIMAVSALVLLLVATIYVHTRYAALLALPVVLFPPAFLADMYFWLHTFGTNLDPKAPLSSSVKPFSPPVLGEGLVGQFRTVALPDFGLVLASLASLLVVTGLWFHRRAYKPLVDDSTEPEPRLLGAAEDR